MKKRKRLQIGSYWTRMSENGPDEKIVPASRRRVGVVSSVRGGVCQSFLHASFCLFVHHWSASEQYGAQTDGQTSETFLLRSGMALEFANTRLAFSRTTDWAVPLSTPSFRSHDTNLIMQ